MAIVDEIFKNTCKDILTKGTSDIGENVRTVWDDTKELAHTKRLFGVVNRYDLRKEFPALTLRKTGIKSATEEILWIYQKNSNNVNDLKTRIWDAWANEHGSIGKSYGYQVGKLSKRKITQIDNMYDIITDTCKSVELSDDCKTAKMTQMDYVLYELKANPFSRRLLIDMRDTNELIDMALEPCAWSVNFVTTKNENGTDVLNMILNQRSNDFIVANNWNLVQYSILLMMVAQVSNMIAGEIIHSIADCHIYDRHEGIANDLISRDGLKAPIVTLNPEITNFYDFTPDDVIITDYETHPQIKNIPVAV